MIDNAIRTAVKQAVQEALAEQGVDLSQRYLTVAEVAKYLALGEATVREACASGQLRAAQFGSAWRIAPADLKAFTEAAYAGNHWSAVCRSTDLGHRVSSAREGRG